MGQEFTLEEDVRSTAVASGSDEFAVITEWTAEMARYHEEMKALADEDPDEALRWMAATAARVAEMRFHLPDMRHPKAASLLKKKVEPFLDDIERQFRYASRRIALIEQELRMTTGRGA